MPIAANRSVTLREERAYVEREPLNDAVTDAEIGEREVEIHLRREKPVLEQRTVAKERVTPGKGATGSMRRVAAGAARERIESDGDKGGEYGG